MLGINSRGCSGEPNRKSGAYHLGFTDDMKQFLSIISDKKNAQGMKYPIYLVELQISPSVC